MAIGYLFIYPARGKFFILMGYARDSGKSVLGNFIQRLYPKESVSNLRLSEMKGTFALICYNKSHSDGYLTQKRVKNLDESSYVYVKGDFEPLVSEEMWDRCQQILLARSARVIDENGKKHKYMRNTPKSVWTAKLRCSCGAGFIQFKWRVNRDGAVVHGFQCYRRTRRPSISCLCVTSAQNSRWSAMMKANYWNCRRTGCSGAAQIIWLVLVSSPEQTVRAT